VFFSLRNNVALIMLEKNQIRKTPFRLEVLKLFTTSESALSLKEIESQLNDFDRITLYRTLKLFKEKGIMHEILHSKGKKYALCKDECDEHKHQHEHLHFHCSKCKESLCVENQMKELNLPGYIIEHSDLNVYGVCKKCNA
jgi:Fur family ferric uptake transcriptional regulator